jgi:hypothetical protein
MLVSFEDPWSKALIPGLDELATAFRGRLRLVRVNRATHLELAARLKIRVVPSLIGSVMAALNRILEPRHVRIGALFGLLLMLGPLGSHLAHGCTVVLEDWAPALTLATTGAPTVHDLFVWKNKLWIAQGRGVNGKGTTVIRSYDINTDTLRTEFEVPVDTYSGLPYWRVLKAFNGALYAGLGNNQDVPGTGDVYKFDGTAWLKVLDTVESDVYALEVYNGQIYAGAGTDDLAAGKLYASPDGTTWTLLKTFTSDHVRALRTWQDKLYIGLKQKGRLWSYDGITFIDHHGTKELSSQFKTLVPYGGKLYVGGVPAKIFSWDGQGFMLELDATATDSEIYKGAVYAGCLFFPTSAKGVGGRVYKFDGTEWILDYLDAETTAPLQVVQPYASYLWVGGGKRKDWPLTLRSTLQGTTP